MGEIIILSLSLLLLVLLVVLLLLLLLLLFIVGGINSVILIIISIIVMGLSLFIIIIITITISLPVREAKVNQVILITPTCLTTHTPFCSQAAAGQHGHLDHVGELPAAAALDTGRPGLPLQDSQPQGCPAAADLRH